MFYHGGRCPQYLTSILRYLPIAPSPLGQDGDKVEGRCVLV
ncbi:hypothetical protein GFS31_21440 [Leptolyngbya sp. BL0902]|nr:hypothetical protein GFS31_21440 [Leptolyngbya sp. BL0902]